MEPPVDPSDPRFDPDMTGAIPPDMDMLPPGTEQPPTYVPSEEELNMQEMLKLEKEQDQAMVPEGWDPNNPEGNKAILQALKNPQPFDIDDPKYNPSAPEFDVDSLRTLDEDSVMELAERYGDGIVILTKSAEELAKYDPNSPSFDPKALGELDTASLESLSLLAEKTSPSEEPPVPEDGQGEEPLESGLDPAEPSNTVFNMDDPKYDPSSPYFDEEALGMLDEQSKAFLAERYGDEKIELSEGADPLENGPDPEESSNTAFNIDDPRYNPSSPYFSEEALDMLDEESMSLLAERYGPVEVGAGEEPIEDEFDAADERYNPDSPSFDPKALKELDEEGLLTLYDMYGQKILDIASDPTIGIFDLNDPKFDPNSEYYDPEAVLELSDVEKFQIEEKYGAIPSGEMPAEGEVTTQTPPPGDGEDSPEEPFDEDEFEDPNEGLDEEQTEEGEDTAGMATASPPPLDMSTSATGLPPGAEIEQEPNLDPATTPVPEEWGPPGEDEEDEWGPEDENEEYEWGPEDEEEEWGLENEWPLEPTDKPTPRPTALYVPFDESLDPLNNEEGEKETAGEAGDEIFYHGLEPQIGPVGKYLDGVGSPEQIEEDKNVQVVGGILLALFLVLILITAHSVMNNPDGLCAG